MLSTTETASSVSCRAPEPPSSSTPMQVTSESFKDGGDMPMDYVFMGCGGKNVSPQLSWSGAPDETKSFAITCWDPDAPTGCGYWHWLLFDIPPDATSVARGKAGGRLGRNDYGTAEYGGPCPPKGDGKHRYIFTVYALDVDSMRAASAQTSAASLIFMMRGHVLAQGTLTGRFGH